MIVKIATPSHSSEVRQSQIPSTPIGFAGYPPLFLCKIFPHHSLVITKIDCVANFFRFIQRQNQTQFFVLNILCSHLFHLSESSFNSAKTEFHFGFDVWKTEFLFCSIIKNLTWVLEIVISTEAWRFSKIKLAQNLNGALWETANGIPFWCSKWIFSTSYMKLKYQNNHVNWTSEKTFHS